MSLSVSCFVSKLGLVSGDWWRKAIFNQFVGVLALPVQLPGRGRKKAVVKLVHHGF